MKRLISLVFLFICCLCSCAQNIHFKAHRLVAYRVGELPDDEDCDVLFDVTFDKGKIFCHGNGFDMLGLNLHDVVFATEMKTSSDGEDYLQYNFNGYSPEGTRLYGSLRESKHNGKKIYTLWFPHNIVKSVNITGEYYLITGSSTD